MKCPNCDSELRTPVVCDACGQPVEPPEELDHFSLFGLPADFKLDVDSLGSAFMSMARRVHPDRYASQSKSVQATAIRVSARLNEAVAVLKDPIRRAEYLLYLHGSESEVESRQVPPSILSRILVMREELDEARRAGDVESIDDLTHQIRALRFEAEGAMNATAEKISQDPDPEVQARLRSHINTLKYYDKLLDEVEGGPG